MKKSIAIFIALVLVGTVAAAGAFNGLYRHTATARLCHKEAPDWTCNLREGYGRVIYKLVDPDGFNTKFVMTGRSLKPNTMYQLKLNSNGPGFEADAFAQACDAPNTHVDCHGTPCYKCGTWGEEGFVVIGFLTTDSKGRLKWRETSTTDLPEGIYKDVKFLVAENGGDWGTPLMEEEGLNFIVVT